MPVYTSKDFRIHLQVPSAPFDHQSWDKFAGGNIVQENQQHNPGGSMPQVAVAGLRKRGPATITRAWDDSLIGVFLALDRATDEQVTCSITPLRGRKQNGGPFTYTGIIEAVNRPDADSSSSNIAELAVVLTLNEKVT